ncbi:MAG: sulfatase-like hydrolase/transferase [Planctomycetota bacterium]|nr:sulfatase-like hydrolase/transferase [Planctomycetota bacterium]
MNAQPTNVILILADQLRADCVGCYGNPVIRTPHIDALAASGTRFNRTFAQHPQCLPSRSALLTGRYPHVNGAVSNHAAMADNETTLGERFITAGYRSIGVGKLHLFEQKEKASFTDTMLSGGQHSGATSPDCLREDYKTWLKENGYWEIAREAYAIHGTDEYWDNFQANVNPMPAEAFIDSWVGDRAVEFIQSQPANEPFFMFVGLPNPHMPFDCPEPYASMYDPAEMPLPQSFIGADLSDKPPIHAEFRRSGRRVNYENLDEPKLRKAMAYYYGATTLVDDQVGKIMAALESCGLLDNTVVAFCSDHGEFLGEFGMLTKSIDEFPMLYDCGLRVPMVIRSPVSDEGRVCDEMVELIDLCPTLLDCAGLDVGPEIQGLSLCRALSGHAPPPRQYVYAESGAVKMLRGEKYKLVHYPGQPFGELYDLESDPHEITNLYDRAEYAEMREGMTRALLDRLIHTEAPLHGESRRGPAYWRQLYRPFMPEGERS